MTMMPSESEIEYDPVFRRLQSILTEFSQIEASDLPPQHTPYDIRSDAEFDLNHLKSALEHLDIGLVLFDADGNLIYCNQKHRDFYPHLRNIYKAGVNRREILLRHALVLSAEDPSMDAEAYFRNSLNRVGTARIYMETKLVDGRWVAIRESKTKSGGLVTVRTDITGRKQAEEALRISEKRTRAVVDNIIDGIITFDDTGIIRSVNPAAQRIFDYTSDTMIGQPVSMLVPETPNSTLSSRQGNDLTATSKRFTGKTQELEGRRANGVHFPLELAVSEMDTHQGSLFVGIFRDISDRKEMDRLKREFVSTVSHELRTPLTAIQGALGLISGGAAGAVSGNAAALITIAEKNSKRLNNLVNDILDMEKIESGKIEYQFVDVALDRLVEQSIADNKPYGEKFRVNFRFVGAPSDTKVFADPARLQQVMANLLSNAAKFSLPESVVEVKAERNGSTARVSVIDYGSGIPESFTDRIFEKFSQADSSNKRTQGGTGLGLSISRAIIEQHNGSIGFDADRKDGATFYFDLPVL